MRLVVFHYHDRPGGVRSVITRGLPVLTERLEGVSEVVLLAGELTDRAWLAELATSLGKTPLRLVEHAELGYGGRLGKAGTAAVAEALSGGGGGRTVLWAHNLSVGRNLPLLLALPGLCAAAGAELWMQHHDWWWDGRWERWADWLALGVESLDEALRLSVPTGPGIRHFCVNAADLPALRSVDPGAVWTGVPLPEMRPPPAAETSAARAWLMEKSGGRPVWLAPVRALRRKNLAEALWLAKAAEVCLVTTGGASSAEELPAWRALQETASRHRLAFCPGVLAEGASGPSVPALLTAADAVAVTSLREGFGLPYLEAAALGRPLLARITAENRANLAPSGCLLNGYERLPVSGDPARPVPLPATLPRELLGLAPRNGPDDFGALPLSVQLEFLVSRAAPFLTPSLHEWPAAARHDIFSSAFASPLRVFQAAPASLRDEVERRLAWWLTHPLLYS